MIDNCEDRVLISGAGPVGLTAALALLNKDIPVTLIDSYKDVPTDPRASTFHPPTMELLEKINVTKEMLEKGLIVNKWQYRDRKKGIVAEFDLEILSDITKYPFRLHFEQHKYAQMLLNKVSNFKICRVIKNSTVLKTYQDSNGVSIEYNDNDSTLKKINGKFLIGCDGGKSIVRQNLGVSFNGLTFEERFLVLTTSFNFKPYGFSGTCYISDPDEWCSIFNVPANGPPGHWRLVFPESSNRTKSEIFNDLECQKKIQDFFPHPESKLYDILHKNIYNVHQRIAGKFRVGRIFLCGDAAHINNPLGGMGLNFGIHDAMNIAEKIYLVWTKKDNEDIFDKYDRQRRTVAEEYLLAQTAQNKKDLEEKKTDQRIKRQKYLSDISKDNTSAKAYLMKTAMFESTKRANEIN
ncbi:MAG: monooxygenase [Rhodospirillaceae bacterium]|nr:monooxygenase [Rhodospirillaceae bacterium]|tara:strand:+ start:2022 stop:3245 length:1224 start_codon:yes stop_codon:yes gene_type:complete